jgi:putative spermidine/putrescine transport system permease protein
MNEPRRAWLPYALVGAPATLLIIFFVIPVASLLSMSFLESDGMVVTGELTLLNYATVFGHRLYVGAIIRTFVIGVGVGALVIVLAYPLAYFLVRTTSRWKGVLIAVSLAPLLASVIVRTYGWYVILNREGALNRLLLETGIVTRAVEFLPSTGAIIVGLAHALLPYGVLSIVSSLNALNPNLERAAMSLGANRFRTFLSITLPLTLPGIAGGFLLAFSIAISAYATPAILGGPATETMATLVRSLMVVQLDWTLGAAMGSVLLVSTLGLFMLASVAGSRRSAA